MNDTLELADLISERLDRLDSLASVGKRIKDTPMLRAFADAIGRDVPRTNLKAAQDRESAAYEALRDAQATATA